MSKLTPLHDLHRELGATFVDFAGWSMPLRYASEVAEHHAVRRAAGIFDLSHMGEIEVYGPGAPAALDRALVGRPSAIDIGRARYTMLCYDTGGILDDLVVYRLDEHRYLIVANASNTLLVMSHLRECLDGHTAHVHDATDDWALIAVQGPRSAQIVADASDADVPALRYYGIDHAAIAGHQVLLARTGYTGEDGFEVYCQPSTAQEIWSVLTEAGAGGGGLVPAGLAARDTLRLEAGMPLYGQELSVHVTPFEVGLGRLVTFDKRGGFVGERALLQRRADGPRTSLVGLEATGRRAPRNGHAVLDPQTAARVGTITSGTHSPTLGRPIAMAHVDPSVTEPGTKLTVQISGQQHDVEVVALPFYRRPA